jgi:hypothetical protein
VSATRATDAGATLAVGDNFAKTIATTVLGAACLGLATLLVTVPLAAITWRARSRTG